MALQANLSAEAGVSWYTSQLQWSAVRINFKPSQTIVAYADFSQIRASNLPTGNAQITDFSGFGYGGGVFFAVEQPFLVAHDVAFKAAYHSSEIDESGSGSQADTRPKSLQQSQWSAEFLFSPIDPLYENGLSWYSTLGFVSTSARSRSEGTSLNTSNALDYRQKNGAAFGAGLVKPTSRGRIYAGFEWLSDDPLIGVGISHSFR